MSESALVQSILVEASSRGHRLFRNDQGVARYSRGGHSYSVAYGVGGPGAPDLIGWTRTGEFCAIEVKVRGKKPKAHQAAWMAAALESCAGLRVGWANSVSGAMEILEGPLPPT